MNTPNDIIQIKNVFKHYPVGHGTFTALKNISLTIKKGAFMGLVGPSGSGKTTMLNLIGALDAPSEGEISVLSTKIDSLNHRQAALFRRDQMGFIFQSYNLLPVYNVYENVEFPLLLQYIPPDKRKDMVMQALEWVGLQDKLNSRPSQLSGGEGQRVAIARAIVKKPSIVLADEPTANIDSDNAHRILKTMEELNKNLGTTFIFATHDEKVIKYLKRKVMLVDGTIKDDILSGVSNDNS